MRYLLKKPVNDAASMLFDEHIMPDAIVCASDLIATGVLRAMRDKQLHCPNDIAVCWL